MIYWFFGYPGIGKDYCARMLSRIGNFPHVDADDFLTESDKDKLLKNSFTKKDRLAKLKRVGDEVKNLHTNYGSVAVADSLPDDDSRTFVLNLLPGKIRLILVTAPPRIHKKRISHRKNHFFTEELLESYIAKSWEDIHVEYVEFHNDGKMTKDRLEKLLIEVSGL